MRNSYVLSPMVKDDLCVALTINSSNGMNVISCERFESFLQNYKDLLNLNFECLEHWQYHDDIEKFKKAMLDFLSSRSLWTTLDGVMATDKKLRIRYCPVVFEATNDNLNALNILYNNIYADLNLTIEEMIKQYPLISLYFKVHNLGFFK